MLQVGKNKNEYFWKASSHDFSNLRERFNLV